MKYAIVIFNSLFIVSISIYGQGSFSLSIPAIYNTVEVPNNWSPPTAINRKNQFNGTSWGYGANVIYSFNPKFLNLYKNFTINIGGGYFKQQFNLKRPFNYNSPVQIIYYTDHYSYDNFQSIIGLSYNHPLKHNYSFSSNISYSWLYSLRQKYTPTYSTSSVPFFSQIEHRKYDFGNILTLSFGLKKNLNDRWSIGLNLIIPLYTQWRMDQIFGDDPTVYFHPKYRPGGNIFSKGGNISIEYYLRSNKMYTNKY